MPCYRGPNDGLDLTPRRWTPKIMRNKLIRCTTAVPEKRGNLGIRFKINSNIVKKTLTRAAWLTTRFNIYIESRGFKKRTGQTVETEICLFLISVKRSHDQYRRGSSDTIENENPSTNIRCKLSSKRTTVRTLFTPPAYAFGRSGDNRGLRSKIFLATIFFRRVAYF